MSTTASARARTGVRRTARRGRPVRAAVRRRRYIAAALVLALLGVAVVMAVRLGPHAVKELTLHIRNRLEVCVAQGAAADRPAVEALILMQKAIEESERGDSAFATKMIRHASESLLETPLFAEPGELLDRWTARMRRRGSAYEDC